MKKILVFLFLLFLLFFPLSLYAEGLFTKGVNLTEWFQASSPRAIQFSKFTKKDFQDIKSLGCDVIRFPINLQAMTSGAPDYKLDPLFLRFLDEVVDICEELKISIILDNHTFDPNVPTPGNIEEILTKEWIQMAEHYTNRGSLVYFEILNEPHGIDKSSWARIEQKVLKKIRQIDTAHYVIVGGADFNSIDTMVQLPDFHDDKIIYTFHFYDPLLFTHQGADWLKPSFANLKGVPYPYSSDRMPPIPDDLKNTWVSSSLQRDFPNQATDVALGKKLLIAADFARKTGRIVFCGEFGVIRDNATNEDRVRWYETVRKILEKYSIPRTSWDYRSRLGLFNKDSAEVFDYDLNIPVVKALGLNEVPQKKPTLEPVSTGFVLFKNFPGEGLFISAYANHGTIDFYDDLVLADKSFAVRMENLDQYSHLAFGFMPPKNLSILAAKNFRLVITLKLKPGFRNMDLRFLSIRKDDPLVRPWRMRYVLDSKNLKNTSEWQTISIPLGDFTEQGAWQDKWYEPEGLFDWAQVAGFELVSEQEKWVNTGLYISEIKLVSE